MSRPSLARASRVFRLAAVAALALPMLAATASAQETPRAEATPGNELTYEQASQRLDRLLTQGERVRGLLDRRQIDLAALSADLGVDAVGIVSYVTGQMAFEQYPGVLRGPEGTLLSRGGNAFDLAILLATLLTTAGYEVVIERGELTGEQAQALIRQMASPRPAPEPIGNVDAIVTILRQLGRTSGMDADEVQRMIDEVVVPERITEEADFAAAMTDATAIETALHGAGVTLGGDDVVAALVDEAADYAWVRYRQDAEQPWVEAHPAFKDGSAPASPRATSAFTLADGIPAELLHRVRVDVTLERNLDGALETHPIAAPVDEAAMDVALTPLTFSVQSNALYTVADPVDAGQIVGATDLFLASFGSATPDGESVAFGLDGGLYALSEVEGGAFGIQPQPGEVIAGSLVDAIEVLNEASGDGSAATPVPVVSTLTAVWVDYTTVAPDGTEMTVQRTLVDRIGVERRAAGDIDPADPDDREAVTTALLGRSTTMIATGAVPQVYAVDAALRYLAEAAPAYRASLRASYFPDEAVTAGPASVEPGFPGLRPLISTFDRLAEAEADVVAFRATPTIVTYREAIARDPESRDQWVVATAIDVIANARRALAVEGDGVTAAPSAALRFGVWETHAEERANPNPYGLPQRTTMQAFADAKDAGADVVVVREAADLPALSPAAAANAEADLARGYVLVMPASVPERGSTGWWRVDPATGGTLGMTDDGGGQAALEYTLLFSIACAGYGGFAGWGPLTMLANCGGLVGGYGLGVLGFSALVGLIFGAVFLVIGNELGDRKL